MTAVGHSLTLLVHDPLLRLGLRRCSRQLLKLARGDFKAERSNVISIESRLRGCWGEPKRPECVITRTFLMLHNEFVKTTPVYHARMSIKVRSSTSRLNPGALCCNKRSNKGTPWTRHGVGLSEAKRKHFDRLKSHKKCWLIVMLMSVVIFLWRSTTQSRRCWALETDFYSAFVLPPQSETNIPWPNTNMTS